jgi:HlyD family secretion protein
MKRTLPIIAFLALVGCSGGGDVLTGYVEAETLYMSPQDGGMIGEILVKEGDAVAAGTVLFKMDEARARFAAEQAQAAADAVRSRVSNAGALDQAVAEAEAAYELAAKNLSRSQILLSQAVVSRERVDNDRAAADAAKARLEGARAERAAASEDWAAAEAAAGLAKWRLGDLSVKAPAAGTIERIYRRPGEVIAAGEPVLALLPPENLKLRFYAPEPQLSSLKVGSDVSYSCHGCAEGLVARISFIATEPQFTPPVIYSLDERDKLVFLVEARPAKPEAVRPGLPVDVRLK